MTAFVCCNAGLAGRDSELVGGEGRARLRVEARRGLRVYRRFKKVPEGYIGYVEELPGANTQGATLEEARENLREAVQLVIDANRELARQDVGDDVIRESLRIANG